ncbi:hypothetical protein M9H77_16077 [Catharanthus roseus]|uniref:Uncharacterized protein n=1 Tax=Catharanthus roseus TaxID=4058 RepID=A0ACC0B0Q6_CATRO|nr:hypothetical protein M9H77_16077 [Catharanthus roseus]
MAFTAAHHRSLPGSLSSTWCGIVCRHCNRSRPSFSRSSRDRGTPPDRSSRGGWRGRSRPSSGRGTAGQQQQLTHRGRSADAWGQYRHDQPMWRNAVRCRHRNLQPSKKLQQKYSQFIK